jgi:hypothetical protein
MSTTMTELDWQAAVAVFRGSLPRRGAEGRKVSAATIAARRRRPFRPPDGCGRRCSAARQRHGLGFVSGLFAAFRLH